MDTVTLNDVDRCYARMCGVTDAQALAAKKRIALSAAARTAALSASKASPAPVEVEEVTLTTVDKHYARMSGVTEAQALASKKRIAEAKATLLAEFHGPSGGTRGAPTRF